MKPHDHNSIFNINFFFIYFYLHYFPILKWKVWWSFWHQLWLKQSLLCNLWHNFLPPGVSGFLLSPTTLVRVVKYMYTFPLAFKQVLTNYYRFGKRVSSPGKTWTCNSSRWEISRGQAMITCVSTPASLSLSSLECCGGRRNARSLRLMRAFSHAYFSLTENDANDWGYRTIN